MPHSFFRHASRPLSQLVHAVTSQPSKAGAGRKLLLTTSLIRQTQTCPRCYHRVQRRLMTDDKKPSAPSSAALSQPPEEQQPPQNGKHPSSPPLLDPSAGPLPSTQEHRRSALSKRFSSVMDNLQSNIFVASQHINDLTGYSGIEELKRSIAKMETDLEKAQEAVRSARFAYKKTIADRASSQREVTSLLARKDTWTPADLERFTTLYRSDHGNEQAVQEAATKLADAERVAEQTASRLSTSILSRYHEEQIWSDKIRRMSTWGTWGLMGVNILLFLVFQLGFEPWRRKRLTKGFEEKVREALELEKQGREDLPAGEKEKKQEAALNGIVSAGGKELEREADDNKPQQEKPVVDALATVITKDAMSWRQPEYWKAAVLDLFSDKTISLRKQDVTIIALEGAAAGFAVAGVLFKYVLSSR